MKRVGREERTLGAGGGKKLCCGIFNQQSKEGENLKKVNPTA